MRREQKLLLAFGAIVLIPVGIVWVVAWPLLHPLRFPALTAGSMQMPHERALTDAESQSISAWLQAHETGWGPSGEHPPATGTPPQNIPPAVRLDMKSSDGASVGVSLWRFDKGADVIGVQMAGQGPYRMHSFDDADVSPMVPDDARGPQQKKGWPE